MEMLPIVFLVNKQNPLKERTEEMLVPSPIKSSSKLSIMCFVFPFFRLVR